MQNAIFNLMGTFPQNNNNNMAQQSQMNPNFNPLNNGTGMMNNNINSMNAMNFLDNVNSPLNNSFQNLSNSQMSHVSNSLNNPMTNQMNNPMINPMNNPMMNPMMMNNMNNMNDMNNMPNMAQMSLHLQNQYQNQIQNMNQDNQNSGLQSPLNNCITVVFRVGDKDTSEPLKIQCTSSDRVSDLIERYRTKSQDNDPTKKFIFNARELDANLTVGEAGLYEGSNIFVIKTKGIKGA